LLGQLGVGRVEQGLNGFAEGAFLQIAKLMAGPAAGHLRGQFQGVFLGQDQQNFPLNHPLVAQLGGHQDAGDLVLYRGSVNFFKIVKPQGNGFAQQRGQHIAPAFGYDAGILLDHVLFLGRDGARARRRRFAAQQRVNFRLTQRFGTHGNLEDPLNSGA